VLAIACCAVFIGYANGNSWFPVAKAQDAPSAPTQDDQSVYLPVVANEYATVADRLGYGTTSFVINRYPAIRDLHAGWYLEWGVRVNPARPSGIEHAQVVFVHQKLACGDTVNGDRVACPYAQPLDYVFSPARSVIESAARANPGQMWFIGNEMDRIDWSTCDEFEADGTTCKPGKTRHSGQGETLPTTYAKAYRDLYTIIKTADPTAKVGIGGVIQATPLRLQYLSLIWDSYQSQFGQPMPVDLWNVHNFILREQMDEYGAEVPPGLPGNPQSGEYLNHDCTHIDMGIFNQQIRNFRQWMKDRGQQAKPLLVTEYGVLYSTISHTADCNLNFDDPQLIHNFMISSFDYFLNTKDCSIGYAADDCRLVQRWLWFSLDHLYTDGQGNPLSSWANPHTSLFNSTNLQITDAGRLFGNYALQHMNELASPE